MITPKLVPCASWVYGWGDAPDTQRLLRVVEERARPGMTVADVGGGTGIVGLAAALQGAEVVIYEAVPQWRDLIRRNALANDVDVTIRGAFPDDWDGHLYDLLFVNLGRHTLTLEPYSKEVCDAETT